MQQDQDALVQLLNQLLDTRAELVDRLAVKIDGGVMALLSSVDGAAAATEAEIEARRGAEGRE